MELQLINFYNFILALIVSLLLHYIFIRKYFISFLDPWILMFLNQVMILTLMIYSFIEGQILTEHFLYAFFSWCGFVLGLSIFYRKTPKAFRAKSLFTEMITKISLSLFLFIFVINSSIIFTFMGIPLFLNGPRTISAYSEMGRGFGILFYLSWGCQTIITLLSMKIWLVDKKKVFGLIGLFTVVLFNTLNGGSRSGYLDLIMTITLGMYYMKRNYHLEINLPSIFKKLLYILPFYILFSFVTAVSDGYESNVFLALIRRVIGSAEGPFYYFIAHSYTYFHGLNIFNYTFSQILPYFGIIDKNAIDLGVNLSLQSDIGTGTQGFGANPTMYVIGHIAFNNFGIIYCFAIGVFLSFLRYRIKTSFLIWMCLNTTAISVLMDSTLMPLTLFFIFILSPVLIFSIIIGQKKIINKSNLYEKNQVFNSNNNILLKR